MEIHDFTISSYEGLRALFTIVGNLFRTILFVLGKVLSVFMTLVTHFTRANFTVPHYLYILLYWKKKNKFKWKLRLNDHGLSVYNYTQSQSVQNHQNIHVCTQNKVQCCNPLFPLKGIILLKRQMLLNKTT